MGIVQRQSLKNVIVNYTGIIIGAVSTLFIYPLDLSLYGEIQFSLSVAALLSAFLSFGSNTLTAKYFPYFKKNNIKGFLSLILTYSTICIVFALGILFIFKNQFATLLGFSGLNLAKISDNAFVIIPIAITTSYLSIFVGQSYNFKRIVVPDVVSIFSLKFIVPILVLLGYYSIIQFYTVGWVLVASYILFPLIIALYVNKLGGLDLDFTVFKKVKLKKHLEMIRYMLFGVLNLVSSIFVYRIDLIMIGLLISMTDVGYYSIFLFMATAIDVPIKAVYRITGPIISNAMENNDIEEVHTLYKKASSNLFIIGVALFSLIWLNMDTILKIMSHGEELRPFAYTFLFLGITKLLDMATSVNFNIISYSKYFRLNTLFIILLAGLNIGMNYIFIQKIGVIGAALATAISMLLFDILKTGFIYIKFRIHPFNWKYIVITLFLAISIVLPLLFPLFFHSIIGNMIFSVFFIALLGWVAVKIKFSEEINRSIHKYWTKIKKLA